MDEDITVPGWVYKAAGFLLAAFIGLGAAFLSVTPAAPPLEIMGEPPTHDRPQLLVFETKSCIWCHRFRANIAPGYERSHLDGRAPLRYLDLKQQNTAGYRLKRRVNVTPTFVLVDTRGHEVARLRGYPGGGTRQFLPEVESMLTKVPAEAPAR